MLTTSALAIPPMTPVGDLPREQWLAARLAGVGASEAPAICGVRGSALEVYLRKHGELPPVAETEAMRIGAALEPFVAGLYAERTGGMAMVRQVFAYQPENPRLFATLDAVRADGRPVEIKVVGVRMARDWGDEDQGPEGVPEYVLVQVLHQMIASGADAVDVAALIGTELRVYTVPRADHLVAWINLHVAAFLGHLDRREPPPPRVESDGRLMAIVHPGAEGSLNLDGEVAAAGARFLDLGQEIKSLEERRGLARLAILQAMEGHAVATLPDGRRLARRVVTTTDRTQVVRGTTHVVLSEKKGRSTDGQG